jgi:hypothetical protein
MMKNVRMSATVAHKFKIGTSVHLKSRSIGGNFTAGSYEVMAQLPDIDGVLQYRIKNAQEVHHRIAKESELEPNANIRNDVHQLKSRVFE